ncbi:MAG: C39 family peptidase [Chthoniobacterales bacterium]
MRKNDLACAGFRVLFSAMRGLRPFLIVIALAALGTGAWWVRGWSQKSSPLPASGGLWFPVTVLNDVPHFAQNDPRWAEDNLGHTPGNLGQEGCAVASAAMVLASYGADLDPGRLNEHLRENEGYTERGWLYWEKASTYPPVLAEHIYEDDASHFLIDWNLLRGNPVIVRLRYPNGITHFVVIVGKSGHEYLIRDPGAGYERGLYFLSEFGSPIEALRFYKKLPGEKA